MADSDEEITRNTPIENIGSHDETVHLPAGAAESHYGFLDSSNTPGSIGALEHYEILQVLGQGGFGIVFKALDTRLQRTVAIKVIIPALAATSPARKRFLREARAAAAVRHRNVVQIYSVQEEPLPYLVMEFIDGRTLQQCSDALGPMSIEDLLCIGQQIASGLSAAHKKDLLHRDVKPDNILIESGNTLNVKITDFGLARTVDEASITRTGSIAGTPMYMAPEQALEQSVDHRADLFSLGSVLYMMATGRPPFRAASTLAVLRRVAEDTPRAITEITPETPAWFCTIVARLQAKSRDDRFQSAEEVSRLLSLCLEQLRDGGKVTAANHLVNDPESSVSYQSTARARTELRARHSNRFVFGCLMIMTLLIAGFLFARNPTRIRSLLMHGPTDQTTPVKRGNGESVTVIAPAPERAVAPFDSATATQIQLAWSRYLKRPVTHENSLKMLFKLIPPGTFTMGSTEEDVQASLGNPFGKDWRPSIQSEAPQHLVQLTKPCYISSCEVTQQEYLAVMDGNPSTQGFGQPVENVTWKEAVRFCNRLSELEALQPQYAIEGEKITRRIGTGYRLPTEAEWEFACRAGTTTKYWIGESDDKLNTAGWILDNGDNCTHPVALLKANPFGLHDTIGNVLEWVEDEWHADTYAQFANTTAIDPCYCTGTVDARIVRGGCFAFEAEKCGSSRRRQRFKTLKNDHIGFRIVLAIEGTAQK